MKRFGAAGFFFCATLAVAAAADTNAVAPRAMSLQDCLQEALRHNFDVQIERYEPQISLYNLNGAYGGFDPTFNLSGQHSYNTQPGGITSQQIPIPATVSEADSFNSSLGGTLPEGLQYNFSGNISDTTFSQNTNLTESTRGSIGVNLTQPLLKNFWIDETRLTIRVAKAQLQESEQALREQIINTVTAVETAYYELIYAQENVKVQQEALELAQTQLDQDRQRVQVGTLAPLDVQQDEAQVAQSNANLIAAQYTLATDQNALKNLVTDEYVRWQPVDIQPTATLEAPLQLFDLQDSWSKGLNNRPDLKQAKFDVEKQGIQLKYDRNQIFPEIDLTGTYGYNGASKEYSGTLSQFNQGNAPFYSYGAQLSVPLSNARTRNSLKADKATLQQLVLKLKQLEQNVMVQIDNAVKESESDYQSVDASRQARIYAEAALDAEQKKYNVGKSTTFTVLQLQNTLTADRAAEIRSLANYNEALANLSQQEASTLERDHINIETK